MSLEREDGQNTDEPSEQFIQAGIGFGARIAMKVYQAPEGYKNPLKTVNSQPEKPGTNQRPTKIDELKSIIAEMKQRFPRGVFSAFNEFAPQGTITEVFSSTQNPT